MKPVLRTLPLFLLFLLTCVTLSLWGADESLSSGDWMSKFKQGGLTLLVQVGLSLFGATFIVERFFNLKRKAIAPPELSEIARQHWKAGDWEALKRLKDEHPSVLATIISFLASHTNQAPADLSEAAGDIAGRELEIQTQKIYPIAVVATLEPLLGLLGTVVGMIEAFETVALAGSEVDPSLLADGISKALMTTAIGLAIAVPFLGIYHYYKSRISLYTTELEREVTDLVSEWFMADADPEDKQDEGSTRQE